MRTRGLWLLCIQNAYICCVISISPELISSSELKECLNVFDQMRKQMSNLVDTVQI